MNKIVLPFCKNHVIHKTTFGIKGRGRLLKWRYFQSYPDGPKGLGVIQDCCPKFTGGGSYVKRTWSMENEMYGGHNKPSQRCHHRNSSS